MKKFIVKIAGAVNGGRSGQAMRKIQEAEREAAAADAWEAAAANRQQAFVAAVAASSPPRSYLCTQAQRQQMKCGTVQSKENKKSCMCMYVCVWEMYGK